MISFLFFTLLVTIVALQIIILLPQRKLIELFVLVDNGGRICYTGSYSDCLSSNLDIDKSNLKIVKLEGVL